MSTRFGKTAQREAIKDFTRCWLGLLQRVEQAEQRLHAAADRPWLPAFLKRYCDTQVEKSGEILRGFAEYFGTCSDSEFLFDPDRMAHLAHDDKVCVLAAIVRHTRWGYSLEMFEERLPLAKHHERGQVAIECFIGGFWQIQVALTEAMQCRGDLRCVAPDFAAIQVASSARARAEMLLCTARLGRGDNTGILDPILEKDPQAIHRAFRDYISTHGRWPSQPEHAEHLAALQHLDGLSVDTVTRARKARAIPWPPI